MLSGIVIGLLFGFLLKRSRFCAAGGLRDIYLEKSNKGLLSVLIIIFVQSFLYFGMVALKWIPVPTYNSFSFAGVGFGSFLFGMGAILASGCVTMSVVKTGDGRLAGLASLLSFALFATAVKSGFLKDLFQPVMTQTIVEDRPLIVGLVPSFLVILLVWALLFYFVRKNKKARIALPRRYSGWRYYLLEKNWNVYWTAGLIGIVAAAAWFFSNQTGRNGGMGITSPVLSWLQGFHQKGVELNWANYFVLGIVLGSFLISLFSQEFRFRGTDGMTWIKSIIGGAMMGIGAIVGEGCLVGHILVGTATFSMKAWYGSLLMILGLWVGAYVFVLRPYKKIQIGTAVPSKSI